MANQQPITFVFNFNSTDPSSPPLHSEQSLLHPQYYYPPKPEYYYPSPYYFPQYYASQYTHHQAQYYPAQREYYYPPQPSHQHIPESHRSASVAAASHGSTQGVHRNPSEKSGEHVDDAASNSQEYFGGAKEEEINLSKGDLKQDDKLV